MPSVHFCVDGIAMVAAVRWRRSPLNTVVSALAVGLVLLSGGRAMAGFLNIGSVNTFATGSSVGNPVGTWTLGDKDDATRHLDIAIGMDDSFLEAARVDRDLVGMVI